MKSYSNTTFVKVKYVLVVKKDIVQKDSNTTFVKVKLHKIPSFWDFPFNSNTTFVKVKLRAIKSGTAKAVAFKYNIC